MSEAIIGQSAEALRQAFDEGFSVLPSRGRAPAERMLAVRAGTLPYALSIEDAVAVLRCPAITPLPTAVPELLGVACVRGAVVAMYSLAALLSAPRTSGSERSWAVLSASDRSVAFVFDELEGYLEADLDELAAADTAAESPLVHKVLTGETPRGIVDLRAALRVIRGPESGPTEG